MKKFTTILLAMLLVLVIGQATFAKGNISANIGFTSMNFKKSIFEDNYLTGKGGLSFGVSGSYYIFDKFSIAADFSGQLYKFSYDNLDYVNETDTPNEPITFDTATNNLKIAAVVRYDVLTFGSAAIGVQAGVIDTLKRNKITFNDPNEPPETAVVDEIEAAPNMLFVLVGAYADLNLMPKLNLFADVKIPVISFFKDRPKNFSTFFYDVKLGLAYDITDSINAGLVLEVDNCDYNSVEAFITNNRAENIANPSFVKVQNTNIKIGATVGFSF